MKQRIAGMIQNARNGKHPGLHPVQVAVQDNRHTASGEPRQKPGPNTPEGRAAVRLSAYRHGLTGQSLLVSPEEQPFYDEMAEAFRARYRPGDRVEAQALQKIIDANWKTHVCNAVENNLLNNAGAQSKIGQTNDSEINAALGRVQAWVENSDEFDKFGRYGARWNRELDRLLRQYRDLQAERRAAQQEELAALAHPPQMAFAAAASANAAAPHDLPTDPPPSHLAPEPLTHAAAEQEQTNPAQTTPGQPTLADAPPASAQDTPCQLNATNQTTSPSGKLIGKKPEPMSPKSIAVVLDALSRYRGSEQTSCQQPANSQVQRSGVEIGWMPDPKRD